MNRTIKAWKENAYESSQYERAMQDFRTSLEMKDRMDYLHELRIKLTRERSKNDTK